MRRQQTGEPVWDLTFDEGGRLAAPDGVAFLGEVQSEDISDLFVLSHGWGTSEAGARQLYDAMFPLIAEASDAVPGLGPVGFAGIFWPSLWFPDSPKATGPQSAGSTQAGVGGVEDVSAGTAVLSGAEIAESLEAGFADQDQRDAVTQIGQLIDEGAKVGPAEPDDAKRERIAEIHALLRSLAPESAPDGAFEDSGESALLTADDPPEAYQAAAEAFGSAPPGSSTQGLGDWFGNAINGAKDALRVLSYNVMKARAGDIGRAGLGPLLAQLHARTPRVRVHLIGHSFGARLVSFALAGVGSADDSPISSLVLLQGAFSHWSFAHAQDNPFGRAGALHGLADRVHGPLVATFTPLDWAVGVWYPRASFLARQDTSAGVAGRWGGMGSDGFQAVTPAQPATMPVGGGTTYGFKPGSFYRVDASHVINNTKGQPFAGAHSDITKPQVAQLAVAAAAHT
jgi:hypothetical protein